MSYLKAYGYSIPSLFLPDSVLKKGGKNHKGRHCCYVDQDVITLAYDAACQCLKGESEPLDALFFASTNPVFQGRYHGSFLADLLGLPSSLQILDFTSSSRSGSDALILANQLIQAGALRRVLVLTAEAGFPDQADPAPWGHAGVALLLDGQAGPVQITQTVSIGAALADSFSYKGAPISLDPRFARKACLEASFNQALEILPGGVAGLDKTLVSGTLARGLGGALKRSGLPAPDADPLLARLGYTATCHLPLLLVSAVQAGEEHSLLLVDPHNGANLLKVQTQQQEPRPGPLEELSYTELTCYQDYLLARTAGAFNDPAYKPIDMFSSEMMAEREKQALLHLQGQACTNCKKVYLLPTQRCPSCLDTHLETKTLSRQGVVFSFTREHFFPASFAPVTMVVIDLEGGGRITVQETDDMGCSSLRVGAPVTLVLRKMMENDRKPNYFWKCKA